MSDYDQNKNNRKEGFVIPIDDDAVRERKKRQDKKIQDEIDKQQDQYTDGQILNFVRVRFPGHAKSFPFLVGNRKFAYGQKVVAMSDRGIAVGYINSFSYDVEFDPSMLPIKSINKIAAQEDVDQDRENYKKQKETETVCIRLIEKYNLDMNLTHVEFTQFGKKVVFYFTAPARIDFRDLVKDLVNHLKLRIELRQISVRDRSAAIGGIGPCGRLLCCSSFLNKYGNANVRMAKNQNLTLTSNKLNGVCGQLKCCLQYENDVYSDRRDKLPQEQSFIETIVGDKGKVLRLHLLNEQFDMLTDYGKIKRYSQDQFKNYMPDGWDLPKDLGHISDETSNVIGLTEFEAQKRRIFNKEIEALKLNDKKFTNAIFKDLFGEETFIPVEIARPAVAPETKVTTQASSNTQALVNQNMTQAAPTQVQDTLTPEAEVPKEPSKQNFVHKKKFFKNKKNFKPKK